MSKEQDHVAIARAEERIAALRERVDLLQETNQVALNLATDTLNAWKENANEWRGSLNDLQARKIDRAESDAARRAIDEKLTALINSLESKTDAQVQDFRRQLTSMNELAAKASGERQGMQQRTRNMYAALAGLGVLMGIIATAYALLKG